MVNSPKKSCNDIRNQLFENEKLLESEVLRENSL